MPKEKLKTIYVCTQCGETSPRWLGRCPSCGAWNTMTEDVVAEPAKASSGKAAAAPRVTGQTSLVPQKLKSISTTEEKSRIVTGISELDRVLGGGIVIGSVTLIGGEPGIGKSTILLQLCGEVSKTKNVLYVTGEESVRQIKLRAVRLNVPEDNISLVAESDVDEICGLIESMKPDLVVIDSIQTMRCTDIYLVLVRHGQSGQGELGALFKRSKNAGDSNLHRRPCQQGRRDCRPQGHGAYCGYRALL